MTDQPEPAKSTIRNQKSEIALPYPLAVMVESLLFVASEPVPVTQIAEALEVKLAEVEQALAELNIETAARGLRVQRKGDRVQLTTQPECAPFVERFLGLDLTTRLSKPALETLAIIAYQQPVTRAQIEHVRGVNCDAVLSTLLNRGLIEEVGRLETAGRPIQYGTTFAFLQHFGLRSLEDMPSLQPAEAAALEALAEQGQAIAVDLSAPSDQATVPAVAPPPDRPPVPIETQLTLLAVAAPPADRSGLAPELAEPIGVAETDRVVEAPLALDPLPDRPDTPIEPPPFAEPSSNENAAN